MELDLIGAMLNSREVYDEVARLYNKGDFSDLTQQVYMVIDKFYRQDPSANHMPLAALERRINRAYPKHNEIFNRYVSKIPADVSGINAFEDFIEVKKDNIGERLGGLLLEHSHDKAKDLLDQYNELCNPLFEAASDKPVIYNDSDLDVLDDVMDENRIPIYPSFLNEFLNGGLIRGSHSLIYARPEVGKTLVGINLAHGTAKNGFKTLYIGNEDPYPLYVERLLCRFSKRPHNFVSRNREEALRLARHSGWGNLYFTKLFPGSIEEVQRLILDVNPDVVILDQIHNLRLRGKALPKTEALEVLAYHMRMFYSKHCITGVSLTQASDDATNKLYLEIRDVYYSNIGVQGQTDLMIGIGCNPEYARLERRMFNIVKNKMSGRHESIPVQIYREYSGLKGI